MIIETTKQDELDEIRFKSQQEIDSLNHIISNQKDGHEFLYNLKRIFKFLINFRRVTERFKLHSQRL